MSLMHTLLRRVGLQRIPAQVDQTRLPGETERQTSEIGNRATPENSLKYLMRQMWVDPDLRAAILDIRQMDHADGRIKKIHGRMARTAIKGGLKLTCDGAASDALRKRWDKFQRRLHLNRREKLESDGRGLVMEGNLPMQWVLDRTHRVIEGIRMPSETILPRVGSNGKFIDPAHAYTQIDVVTGRPLAQFALWQLSVVRLSPDNYDDFGSLGRPYLDASRSVWRRLDMTEEDLVIRRRTRAPLRFFHQLETSKEDFDTYVAGNEKDKEGITTDFYIRGKGQVSGVQGDANLNQIADVAHLLDTFYSGAPAPKGLFGYSGDLSRDILEDLKRDYFDEIDSLQDTLAYVYTLGFRLDLLLQGIHPDREAFAIEFKERRTDTPNQRADLALKHQALGASAETVFESAGIDPAREMERIKGQFDDDYNPYPPVFPEDDAGGPGGQGAPRVSVTPSNARKGESATTISTRSANS